MNESLERIGRDKFEVVPTLTALAFLIPVFSIESSLDGTNHWSWIGFQIGTAYLTLVRIIVCGAASYVCLVSRAHQRRFWMWAFLFIAIAFNPFVAVRFQPGESAYSMTAFGSAIAFGVSIFMYVPRGERLKIFFFWKRPA